MIAYIKGKLIEIDEESVIIDIHGIGYEIICANPFVFQASINDEVFIHTYHHVREDVQCLYGFKTSEEKKLFIKLISVSGIGPKGGLNILASVRVPEFVTAVEQEDEKYLMQFPGVGKKTARQIILDLKGKLTNFLSISREDYEEIHVINNTVNITEVTEALKTLGYSEREIRSITPQLQKETNKDVEELIRIALTLLVKN